MKDRAIGLDLGVFGDVRRFGSVWYSLFTDALSQSC